MHDQLQWRKSSFGDSGEVAEWTAFGAKNGEFV
jgi:hypothetical protein